MNFKLAFTTHEAAKYACKRWHYSKSLPVGKTIKIGVWENDKFIGCILFAYGACCNIGRPFGLQMNEVCELTRIALTKHINPVSKFLAISLKMIKRFQPKMKMVVSYADPFQNHHGGIYQATNWIYLGKTKGSTHYKNKFGKHVHSRMVNDYDKEKFNKLIETGYLKRYTAYKHKYIYPLEKDLWIEFKKQSKPYPKRSACVV